jgi:hypothetical protein
MLLKISVKYVVAILHLKHAKIVLSMHRKYFLQETRVSHTVLNHKKWYTYDC